MLPTAGTGSQHKKSCCYREETLRDGDDDGDVGDDDDDGDKMPLKKHGNIAIDFDEV